MTEQEPKEILNQMVEHLNEYLETQKEIIKLNTIKHTSATAGNIAAILLLALFLLVMYVFVNVGAALLLGQLINNLPAAFGYIGLINLGVAVILIIFRKQLVVRPIQNIIIKQFTS